MAFRWIELSNILWTSDSLFVGVLGVANIAIELDFFPRLLVYVS